MPQAEQPEDGGEDGGAEVRAGEVETLRPRVPYPYPAVPIDIGKVFPPHGRERKWR